jgi:hypothetical protein
VAKHGRIDGRIPKGNNGSSTMYIIQFNCVSSSAFLPLSPSFIRVRIVLMLGPLLGSIRIDADNRVCDVIQSHFSICMKMSSNFSMSISPIEIEDATK